MEKQEGHIQNEFDPKKAKKILSKLQKYRRVEDIMIHIRATPKSR